MVTVGILVASLLCLRVANAVALDPRAVSCSADNCLRALQKPERASAASSFCSSVLATTLAPSATPAYPTFLSNCGTLTLVQRFSSACSCLGPFTTSSTVSSTTTATSTSPPLDISTTTSGTTSSISLSVLPTQTSTTTSSTTVATCPLVTTITETISQPASTITLGGTQTCPAPSTVTSPGPTVTSTTTTVAYCPLSTNAFSNPGFESGTWSFWDVRVRGPGVEYGVRCDDPANWAGSGFCGFYALFSADATVGSSVAISQNRIHCMRGAYDILFKYKITSGCELDIVYLGLVKETLRSTGSPAPWLAFGAALPWPNDATDIIDGGWSFVARPLGTNACGVSLDDFQWSGPRPW